jgi:putative membrane protein
MTVRYWDGHGAGGWNWFAMSLGMLFFWALVIGAAFLLVRALGRARRDPAPPADSPGQVLAGRFARGEIDEDEYLRRLAVLCDSPPPARHG